MSAEWFRVFASHEEAQELSTGPWRGDGFLGVALPCRSAVGKLVRLRYSEASVVAQCADVGPWCVDDPYWESGGKPRAELLRGKPCPRSMAFESFATVPDGRGGFKPVTLSNGAGIDIFPAVAIALGIPIGENRWIEWSFA